MEGKLALPLFLELKTINFLNTGSSVNEVGEYDVYIHFRHPLQQGTDNFINIDADDNEITGDSGLYLPKEYSGFKLPTGDKPPQIVTFKIIRNKEGRLAAIYSRVSAKSFGDARSIVNDHSAPVLAQLSFLADAAVTIKKIYTIRLTTKEKSICLFLRGQNKTVKTMTEGSLIVGNDFFRSAFALYRLGLNSIDPYAAYGYFYRVIEGVNIIMSEHNKQAKRRGLNVNREKLVLENMDDIGLDFPKYIGETTSKVFQDISNEYRVLISHFISRKSKRMLMADQLIQEAEYWKLVPLIRQIAKKTLFREWIFRRRWSLNDTD